VQSFWMWHREPCQNCTDFPALCHWKLILDLIFQLCKGRKGFRWKRRLTSTEVYGQYLKGQNLNILFTTLENLTRFGPFSTIFFCGAIAQIGPRPPPFEVSGSHTIRHTPGRTSPNEWAARRRGRYLNNTQQTQETNIHAISRIHNPQFQLAVPQWNEVHFT